MSYKDALSVALEHINAAAQVLQQQNDHFADSKSVSPSEIAIEFFQIKTLHGELDDGVKLLYHVKDRLEKSILPERMEENQIDKLSIPSLGRNFGILTKTSASFVDKEKGFEWLRSIGQGDLIQETVNAGTLASFCRNLQLDEGIDPPEDTVKVSTYKTIGVTKYTPKNK